MPRNAFYGDGLERVDLALSKSFRCRGQAIVWTVRFEAFNAFNHVQFGFPPIDFTTRPRSASITGAATSYSPRTLQLVLRYRY